MTRTALALIMAVSACAPESPQPGAASEAAPAPASQPPRDTTILSAPQAAAGWRGKVRVVGMADAPSVTLQQDDGSTIAIAGNLRFELQALDGAVVRVTGELQADTTVFVEGYDVLEIDGTRPFVGQLLAGPRLVVERDTLTVGGSIDAPVGAKVWITGQRTGQTLQIASYGIIRRSK